MYEVVDSSVLDDPNFVVRAINYGNGIYRLVTMTSGNFSVEDETAYAYGLSIFKTNNPELRVVCAFVGKYNLLTVVTEPK